MSTILNAIGDAIYNFLWGAPQSTKAPSTPKPKIPQTDARITEIQKLAKTGVVSFYKDDFNHHTDIFGNFFDKIHLTVDGIPYRCKEGAFQAQKWSNPKTQAEYSNLDGDASYQKASLYQGTHNTKSGWISYNPKVEGGNVKAMRKVLTAFFKPNSYQAKALLATGDAYLVEHIPVKGRDSFWGDDFDGTGKNMLGILLMGIREKLGGKGLVTKPKNASFIAQKQEIPLPPGYRTTQAAKKAGICHYPNCTRAVWKDSRGVSSKACSKRHIRLPANYTPTTKSTAKAAKRAGICHFPNCTKAVWIDSQGVTSKACSKGHLKIPAHLQKQTHATYKSARRAGICHYPNCNRSVWKDSQGVPSIACSRGHLSLPSTRNPVTRKTSRAAAHFRFPAPTARRYISS